jgi:hypothetical protein
VRTYVERQFAIAAPRLTTAEFFNRVQDGQEMASRHSRLLHDFLATADMVKFAGFRPENGVVRIMINQAKQFISESNTMTSNANHDD